jgi:hypothetical protein
MQRQAVGVISGGFCVCASFVAKDGRVDANPLKLNSGETTNDPLLCKMILPRSDFAMAAKQANFRRRGTSDRASNLRSAAQVCTAIRSTIVLSLAARPLADHFSPSPIVGSSGSVAAALIPTIRAGRLVHAFTWSGSLGAEPSSRIGRGGFDYHGRACLRPET